jgi:hypothetical protein
MEFFEVFYFDFFAATFCAAISPSLGDGAIFANPIRHGQLNV